MKLCNQTSDPNECRFFSSQRQGWETNLYAPVSKNKKNPENMGIGLEKKKIYIYNLGSAKKSENLSTLGH